MEETEPIRTLPFAEGTPLSAQKATLLIRVVDVEKNPLGDAIMVEAGRHARYVALDDRVLLGKTGDDGTLSVPADRKYSGFSFYKAGFAPHFTESLTTDGVNQVVLRRADILVLNFHDRMLCPISGVSAMVSIVPFNDIGVMSAHLSNDRVIPAGSEYSRIYSAVSDSTGRATIYSIPEGKYALHIASAWYAVAKDPDRRKERRGMLSECVVPGYIDIEMAEIYGAVVDVSPPSGVRVLDFGSKHPVDGEESGYLLTRDLSECKARLERIFDASKANRRAIVCIPNLHHVKQKRGPVVPLTAFLSNGAVETIRIPTLPLRGISEPMRIDLGNSIKGISPMQVSIRVVSPAGPLRSFGPFQLQQASGYDENNTISYTATAYSDEPLTIPAGDYEVAPLHQFYQQFLEHRAMQRNVDAHRVDFNINCTTELKACVIKISTPADGDLVGTSVRISSETLHSGRFRINSKQLKVWLPKGHTVDVAVSAAGYQPVRQTAIINNDDKEHTIRINMTIAMGE